MPGGCRRLAPHARRGDPRGRDVLADAHLRERGDARLAEHAGELRGVRLSAYAIACHDLGEHDRGVALLAIRSEERALQRQHTARHAGERAEPDALELHRTRRLLDAPRSQDVRPDVVALRDGRLDGSLPKHDEGVRGGGGKAACRGGIEDADRGTSVLDRPLGAQHGRGATERDLGERDELGERDRRVLGGVCGHTELLEGPGNVKHRPERRRGLRGTGGRRSIPLDVGHQELGRRRPEPPASQLARCRRDLRGDHARGFQLLQYDGGREQAVGAPLGVETPGASDVHVGDLGEQEVGEVPRGPPRHVRERHAHGARTGGVRDRDGRRPAPFELREMGDRAHVPQEGPTGLQLRQGTGELRPRGDTARRKPGSQLAPGARRIGRRHDDVLAALVRKGSQLTADELRLGRRPRRKDDPHRAGGRDRAHRWHEERGEKVLELRGAHAIPRDGTALNDRDVERLREPLGERSLDAPQPREPNEGDRRYRGPRCRQDARQLVHDLAALDESVRPELVSERGQKPHQRALRLARVLGHHLRPREPRKPGVGEVGKERGDARRVDEREGRAPAGPGEHAGGEQVARGAVRHATTVPPDPPALLGPGGGRAHGDTEREVLLGKGALNLQRLREARDEDDGPPARRERRAHARLQLRGDELLVRCCEDAQRHDTSAPGFFSTHPTLPRAPDKNAARPSG